MYEEKLNEGKFKEHAKNIWIWKDLCRFL